MSEFTTEPITLKYWGGRGLMEVPRQLLAAAGKFPPADYTDMRCTEPASDLDANLGRMPICVIGDRSIGQSSAINLTLAMTCGLMGDSALDAGEIQNISEHLKEMNTAYRTICPYGSEPTEEQNDKWFDSGASDVSGTADRAGYGTRYLTWFMGRIENTLGSNGFAVGGKLSLADILLYNTFMEHLTDSEAGDIPQWKREPFGSTARINSKLASHPKIAACCNTVANNTNIQKWLAMRGPQGF